MSTLVLQIPARSRLRPGEATSPAERDPTGVEYLYSVTTDGLDIDTAGQCVAALLPKADQVVAVLADADVAWHRITLPKAPTSRMRAALIGVLEEAVLEDTEAIHFAVAPNASAGKPTWIAAVNRAWLRSELSALERANVFIDRVVPSAWPDDPPTGHFAEVEAPAGGDAGISFTWSHPDGVATLRLQGGLARALIPQMPLPNARWSATPGAAAAAEQWLSAPVNVMAPSQRLLQAARTLWNLRQFDLARRNRGMRALRDAGRKWRSAQWRPVRWGLASLVLAHIVGLNLWSWHQSRLIAAKREQQVLALQATFPNVRAVLDAPAQMQREVQALRNAAGTPGETDLEPMLYAAASAWPADRPAMDTLRYEPGKLAFTAGGWGQAQTEQMRDRLRPAGWQVDTVEGRVVLSRASGGLR